MPFVSCSSAFSYTWVNCSGTIANYGDVSLLENIATCTVEFTIQNNYLRCDNGVINYTDISQIPDDSYLFKIDNYQVISGYFLDPTNIKSKKASLYKIQVPPVNPSQDLNLNGELMKVLAIETMILFGSGLLLGGIISMMRKTQHK